MRGVGIVSGYIFNWFIYIELSGVGINLVYHEIYVECLYMNWKSGAFIFCSENILKSHWYDNSVIFRGFEKKELTFVTTYKPVTSVTLWKTVIFTRGIYWLIYLFYWKNFIIIGYGTRNKNVDVCGVDFW